jgi:hypothetical protein
MKHPKFRRATAAAVALTVGVYWSSPALAWDDTCESLRQPIEDVTSKFDDARDEIIGSTLKTCIVTGVIVGLITRNFGKAAAACALSGVAQLIVSYREVREKEAPTQEAFREAVERDAGADDSRMSAVGQAIRDLAVCRLKQVDDVEQREAAGTLTKEDAIRELEHIQKARKKDVREISELLGTTKNSTDMYIGALSQKEGVSEDKVLGEVASYQGESQSLPETQPDQMANASAPGDDTADSSAEEPLPAKPEAAPAKPVKKKHKKAVKPAKRAVQAHGPAPKDDVQRLRKDYMDLSKTAQSTNDEVDNKIIKALRA